MLRSLAPKYDTKVFSLEESKDLKIFSMDELLGSLTAYEMRTTGDASLRKEATFNTTRKGKEVAAHKGSNEESDEEVANYVKKLKRGSRKYKGKIPLKCFNCGNVGHFFAKCPYNEIGGDESRGFKRFVGKDKERNVYWQGRRGYQKIFNLYTIEAEVDLEGELISALKELSKTRRELKKVKLTAVDEQGLLKQSLDESSQVISDLKL